MAAFGNLLPLIVLLIVVSLGAFIGYQIYAFANQMAERGTKHMGKKNIVVTKEGMKVAVKPVRDEEYEDKTQSLLVKAWNYSAPPGNKNKNKNKKS